jgi:hypothetical protein
MKSRTIDHVKNFYGWKTNRKIVVFSVDDYGNVRLDSGAARKKLDDARLKIYNRFDAFDALENKEDLEMLFEVLTSVKDKNGSTAVFTPFALPCNIDFERIAKENYSKYYYELLPQTFSKLSQIYPNSYEGTWDLWKEGIDKGIMKPQFHGREHLNLKVFEEKLQSKDHELMTALKNRSYTSIGNSGYSSITTSGAFDFWYLEENDEFCLIIEDGLDRFEEVYGYKAVQFNSPGASEHPCIHEILLKKGIKYIDTTFLKIEHQGKGRYKKILNYHGKTNSLGQVYQMRNVVFEPTDERGINWVDYTIKQIEIAFFWNKPAIISSHRVNFCGHIET